MKQIITMLLLVLSISMFAQERKLGIKGGIGLNNISSKYFFDKTENLYGADIGITYEAEFNDNKFWGIDLLFMPKGFCDNVTLLDTAGNVQGEGTAKFVYYYLSMPIKYGFRRGNKFSYSASIGLVPSFLLKNNMVYPQTDGGETISHLKSVDSFELSGLVEIGADYELNSKFVLFSTMTFMHSFTSITNDDYFSSSDIWLYNTTISFGLKYKLKPKG